MEHETEESEEPRAAGSLVAGVVMAVMLLIIAAFVGQFPVAQAGAETTSAAH